METSFKNANLLVIYLGKLISDNIFETELAEEYYNKVLQTVANRLFKNTKINETIYNYNNMYNNITTGDFYKANQLELKKDNKKLTVVINKEKVGPLEFECRLDYNKTNNIYTKFNINHQTTMYFDDINKTIKIEIEYNAYVKDNLKLIDELI